MDLHSDYNTKLVDFESSELEDFSSQTIPKGKFIDLKLSRWFQVVSQAHCYNKTVFKGKII